MKLAICIDNSGGMLFCHRRQSRDRELIRDLSESLRGGTLFSEAFSETVLAETAHTVITRDKAESLGEKDIFFIECPPIAPLLPYADELIVYHWNRAYPSDESLDIRIDRMTRISLTEFVGSSHEKITKEIFRP